MPTIADVLKGYGFTDRQVPYIEKSLRKAAIGARCQLSDLVIFYGKLRRSETVEQRHLFELKRLCPGAHAALLEVVGVGAEHLYRLVKAREIDFSDIAEAFARITSDGVY